MQPDAAQLALALAERNRLPKLTAHAQRLSRRLRAVERFRVCVCAVGVSGVRVCACTVLRSRIRATVACACVARLCLQYLCARVALYRQDIQAIRHASLKSTLDQ